MHRGGGGGAPIAETGIQGNFLGGLGCAALEILRIFGRLNLPRGVYEPLGFFGSRRAYVMKKSGAVSRPSASLEFQFPESTDLRCHVKGGR